MDIWKFWLCARHSVDWLATVSVWSVSRWTRSVPGSVRSSQLNHISLSSSRIFVAILGSEYCSGYIDQGSEEMAVSSVWWLVSVGKWNTGFYCPAGEDRASVYCCGGEHHKYCCTTSPDPDLATLLPVLLGAATAILGLLVVVQVCCPCSWSEDRRREMKEYPADSITDISPYTKLPAGHGELWIWQHGNESLLLGCN